MSKKCYVLMVHPQFEKPILQGGKMPPEFYVKGKRQDEDTLAKNDGFYDIDGDPNTDEFIDWFYDYPDGVMALIHFTDFRYGRETK